MPSEIQTIREPATVKRAPPATAPAPPPLWAVVTGGGGPLEQLDRDYVMRQLKEKGAVLFRGFNVNMEDFVNFTGRFCGRFLTHAVRDFRPNRSGDGTVANVLVGNNAVSLHAEMNYSPFRPELLWFHCIQPAARGGETLVADSRQMLANLNERTRKQFEKKGIRYRYVVSPDIWRAATKQPFRWLAVLLMRFVRGIMTKAQGKTDIRVDFRTRAIRPTTPVGEPGFLNSIENALEYSEQVPAEVTFSDGEPFSKELLGDIAHAARLSAQPVQWQPNDVLLIDNRRMLHGRAPFEGSSARTINVRFGMLPRQLKRMLWTR